MSDGFYILQCTTYVTHGSCLQIQRLFGFKNMFLALIQNFFIIDLQWNMEPFKHTTPTFMYFDNKNFFFFLIIFNLFLLLCCFRNGSSDRIFHPVNLPNPLPTSISMTIIQRKLTYRSIYLFRNWFELMNGKGPPQWEKCDEENVLGMNCESIKSQMS